MKRLLLVGLSVVALAACGNTDDGSATAARESSAAPGQQAVTPTVAPSVGAVPNVVIPNSVSQIPALPTEVRIPSVEATPQVVQPVACIEPGSSVVVDALASIPQYFPDEAWTAGRMGDPCASFTWVEAAASPYATASTPEHILFFAGGVYLGTATAAPYSFTSVVGQTGDTVTVNYRWLVADEAFANPEGGPAAIRYQWDGSQVNMLDTLPTEVTG